MSRLERAEVEYKHDALVASVISELEYLDEIEERISDLMDRRAESVRIKRGILRHRYLERKREARGVTPAPGT
jgi:hypothetical protein